METKRTDKALMGKGLRTMVVSLLLMFIGPSLFYVATTNQEKPLYIPLLVLSLLLCAGAIFFGFKGIQTIMNSMFGKKSN